VEGAPPAAVTPARTVAGLVGAALVGYALVRVAMTVLPVSPAEAAPPGETPAQLLRAYEAAANADPAFRGADGRRGRRLPPGGAAGREAGAAAPRIRGRGQRGPVVPGRRRPPGQGALHARGRTRRRRPRVHVVSHARPAPAGQVARRQDDRAARAVGQPRRVH